MEDSAHANMIAHLLLSQQLQIFQLISPSSGEFMAISGGNVSVYT
jgi:hypothetical protein